jgi:acyl-CoA synthetase (AMP-forming)/AMP-acid ligase II
MGLRHVTLGDIMRRNAQLCPDRIVIVCGIDALPKTGAGAIDRAAVKQAHGGMAASADLSSTGNGKE